MLSLKVGYKTFTVRDFSDEEASQAPDVLGLCVYDDRTILVDGNQDSLEQARILLHELIHACFDHSSAGAKPDMEEEDVCGILDRSLTMVLLDNPHLTAVIHQAIHHGQCIV